MSDRLTSVNEDGVFEPFPIDRVPWEEYAHGERFAMRFQHLSSFGGGSQISLAMEILPAGRQANQAHYHLLEEEHVFVLEGSLTLTLGSKTFVMSPGHYVCFPAGQTVGHALFNHTDAPCRYLVLGNPQKHDVAVHTETGRVSVKLTGEIYAKAPAFGYWEGVEDGTR
jgi:uncharacterized cupin superfamily protein